MTTLLFASALCYPVPCTVVLCCRLCGKRVDWTCMNCFSDGNFKCCCCQIEARKFRRLSSQPERECIASAVPSAASGHANGYRSQHTATHPTASNTGDYSYANPNRVIFSLPPPRRGRSHAGAHPNTRLEDPRPYEVPQPTYESTGTTLRHSVLPQESKRQLSHTGATIVAQPRSALSPTRPDRHPKHHPTGPTQDAIQHFASPSPALPPKGIRASSGSASHSGRDEWSAHYKLNLAPDPRGSNDCPLPAAGCDGDTFPALPQSHYITLTEDASAMVEAATSVPICATPPPLPPKPSPSTVPILTHPGASVDLQESVP